jgi:hypothetical protein
MLRCCDSSGDGYRLHFLRSPLRLDVGFCRRWHWFAIICGVERSVCWRSNTDWNFGIEASTGN